MNETHGVHGDLGATFNPLENNIFLSNGIAVSGDESSIISGSYNEFFDSLVISSSTISKPEIPELIKLIGLFISCATPAINIPNDAIFSDCTS